MGSLVGFLTIILAVWLWLCEDRRWVRNLGVIAVVGVILQGILGGLRVTMMKDQIGIFHACVAQAFLALLVFIALVTTQILAFSQLSSCRFAKIFANQNARRCNYCCDLCSACARGHDAPSAS